MALAPGWAPWLDRWGRWLVAASLIPHLLAFTGRWRIGSDSALYRELGQNLAHGRGYTYHGAAPELGSPGLPYLLGALQWLFGPAAWPMLVVNLLLVMAILLLTFVWTRRLTDRPTAYLVAAMTGVTGLLVWLTTEVLTDVLYLAGTMAVLLAVDIWARPTGKRRWGAATLLTLLGGVVCVTVHPRFLLLIAAAPLAGVWALARKKPKTAAGLGLLFAVIIGLLLYPPVGRLLVGGYAVRLQAVVGSLLNPARVVTGLASVFEDEMPQGVFGFHLGPVVNTLSMLAVLAGVGIVGRRRPLAACLTFVLVLALVLSGAKPRYFLMVSPVLLLGWLAAASWLDRRLPATQRGWALTIAVAAYAGMNLAHAGKVVMQQHASPFVEHYRDGAWVKWVRVSEAVKRVVPEGEAVLTRQGRVVTFLSDRAAVDVEQDPRAGESPAQMLRRLNVRWVIQPLTKEGQEDQAPEPLAQALEGFATHGQPVYVTNNLELMPLDWE